ncbi:MAG: hypothetical protein HY293_02665 [Planctomycetes bacterium]|nr:hypothetical protein [Planctomycetota bacterium]
MSAYAQQLREEATRDQARDRLVHLGKPALAFLEKLPVDAAQLSSIRQEIALNETLGPAYAPPHTFTFEAAEENLGTLLSRLETAAGVTFHKNSLDLLQKIAVRVDDATYWEALDEICKKASIWYYPANDPLYLNGGMASGKPRCYYGPVMIVLDRIVQQRKVTFEKIETEYILQLMCVWEKQVQPLGPTGKYTLTQVRDDTGSSLLPPPRPPVPARPAPTVRIVGQGVNLSGLLPPSPEAKTLSRVEGTMELEFPARVDEVRMAIQPDNPTAVREIEGAVVELKNFAPQSTWGSAAEMVIRFKDPKEAASFRIGAGDVEFIAPGDARRNGWIGSTTRDAEKGIFTFTAHRQGRQDVPKEIRLRIPRGSVIKSVPFCYKDVELK